jgi:hypothetical protein
LLGVARDRFDAGAASASPPPPPAAPPPAAAGALRLAVALATATALPPPPPLSARLPFEALRAMDLPLAGPWGKGAEGDG